SRSYTKHPAHKALFDALALSLSMDEDDMEKKLNQPPVQKKRHRDDHDQDPLTDAKKDFKKKKKKDSDEPSSKKTTYQPTSSKKGTTPSKPLKSDKSVQADETIEELDQEEAIDDEEPAVDEMVNTEEHPQDDDGLSQDRFWSSTKVAYDKDAALGISHWDNQFRYGYLKEIVVRRAYLKEYSFREADFSKLHLNDIEDLFLLYVQRKIHNLSGDEIVHLMVRDNLHDMLHNFKLGYNDAMSTRKWPEKDQERTAEVLKLIVDLLLERRIMRSLECYVGGRLNKMDCKLRIRTI
ncbi:hypothetical protein Tco_0832653, partial [Tanacetum coccineum]